MKIKPKFNLLDAPSSEKDSNKFAMAACPRIPSRLAGEKSPAQGPPEEISSQKEIGRSLSNPKNDESWWKKGQNQGSLMVLIILAGAVAPSASIWIYYSSGGLMIHVHK